MKLALFGASGMIGSRILDEALRRNHEVTAIVRDPSRIPQRAGVTPKQGDASTPDGVAQAAAGHDAVISALGPGPESPQLMIPLTRALVEGLSRGSGPKRLVMVGGAATLEVAPGVRLLDTGNIPEAWMGIARAHAEALELLRKSDLDWTSFSPAALIEPGERTGKFRLDNDQLVVDQSGQSRISAEDYAIALLDEVETPRHIRQRFTIGY